MFLCSLLLSKALFYRLSVFLLDFCPSLSGWEHCCTIHCIISTALVFVCVFQLIGYPFPVCTCLSAFSSSKSTPLTFVCVCVWGCLLAPSVVLRCVLESVGAYWSLMVPTGVWGHLMVSEGAYWILRVPISVWGSVQLSVHAYWCLTVPTCISGCLLVSVESCWCL